MSAMVYWLLVPVRLSGNPSQQRRTTLSRLSSTSIPTLNQTQPAKTSRPVLFQAGVVLRPHPRPPKWELLLVKAANREQRQRSVHRRWTPHASSRRLWETQHARLASGRLQKPDQVFARYRCGHGVDQRMKIDQLERHQACIKDHQHASLTVVHDSKGRD